jgi:hypothetical protein
MSGNQYVYVVEIETKNRSTVELVTKNLKEADAAYSTRSLRFRGEGWRVDDFFQIKRGEMWRYVKPGSRNVCIKFVRLMNGEFMAIVRITAWVIKWAKDEKPTFNSMKAQHGIAAIPEGAP